MIATDAVRALIRKGDDHQLRSQISVGRAEGMMTMEQSLAELVRAGRITRETAYAHGYPHGRLTAIFGGDTPCPGGLSYAGIARTKIVRLAVL